MADRLRASAVYESSEVFNGFKETEIGYIPSEWDVARIGTLGKVVTGTTPSMKKPEYYGGPYRLISPADLDEPKYFQTAHNWLTEAGLKAARELPRDTVLVSCIGNIGKLGLTRDERSATNQQINAIICGPHSDPHFVYYMLMHKRSYLESFAVKTTVPILNKSNFEEIRVLLPPLPEQRAIAHVLSTIQRAIAAQDAVIAAAREVKRSLMQRLFTYGPYADLLPTKETEIGEVPETWDVVTLDDIRANSKGSIVSGPFGSNIGKRFFVSSGVPLIRGNNLTKGEKLFVEEGFVFITEEKAEELKSCTALANDLVFTAAGTIGQVGLIPNNSRYPKYIISNKQLRARVDESRALPLFLYYWFSAPRIQRLLQSQRRGTSIPVINLSILRNLPVPLPSMPEQSDIARFLSVADHKIEIEEARKSALQSLFKSMLHQLMTGQVRVHQLPSMT